MSGVLLVAMATQFLMPCLVKFWFFSIFLQILTKYFIQLAILSVAKLSLQLELKTIYSWTVFSRCHRLSSHRIHLFICMFSWVQCVNTGFYRSHCVVLFHSVSWVETEMWQFRGFHIVLSFRYRCKHSNLSFPACYIWICTTWYEDHATWRVHLYLTSVSQIKFQFCSGICCVQLCF